MLAWLGPLSGWLQRGREKVETTNVEQRSVVCTSLINHWIYYNFVKINIFSRRDSMAESWRVPSFLLIWCHLIFLSASRLCAHWFLLAFASARDSFNELTILLMSPRWPSTAVTPICLISNGQIQRRMQAKHAYPIRKYLSISQQLDTKMIK